MIFLKPFNYIFCVRKKWNYIVVTCQDEHNELHEKKAFVAQSTNIFTCPTNGCLNHI